MLVIPRVNSLKQNNADMPFVVKPQFVISIGEFEQDIFTVFENRVKKLGVVLVKSNEASAAITLLKSKDLGQEAYRIEISSEHINVYASSNQGVNLALATLYQLFAEAKVLNNNTINAQIIEDCPKYSYRGLLVDVGRHFFGVSEMKKIIEEMSVYKLNVLHWHLTEDQGWRIESKVYPKLTEISSGGRYYTQDDIKEVVRFATERGVEIIPEIDMPGHTTAAIAAYPELSCEGEEIQVGENAGVYKVIMCAGKDSTYQWIYRLLDEIVPLFPSKFIHLGGDEAPKDKWKECEHCNEKMKQHGIKEYEDLQGLFVNQVKDYLDTKGKTVICWNDSLKAKNVSSDIVTQYWLESSAESYTFPYYEAGRKMIFSNVFNMYFDYPHCVTPLKKTYDYSPLIFGHSNLNGKNVMGIEGAIWTERVPEARILENAISVRIQALAEAAWTHDRNYEDFVKRVKAHLLELGLITLDTLPFEQVTVEGKEAEAQAMSFMQAMMGMMSGGGSDMGLSPEEMKGMAHMFITNIFTPETAEDMLAGLGF
jgi:N-acetyl-beta-hexosaminidase